MTQELLDIIRHTADLEADSGLWFELISQVELLLVKGGPGSGSEIPTIGLEFLNLVPWHDLQPRIPVQHIRLIIRLGRLLDRAGHWNTALKVFNAAIRESDRYFETEVKPDYEFCKVTAVAGLEGGELYRRIGRHEEAAEMHHRALNLAVSFGLEREQADAHNNLAIVYIEQGNLSSAQTELEASLELAESLDDHRLAGHCYNNLGVLTCIQGKFSAAIVRFQHALPYREIANDIKGLAETCHNMAMAYKDLDDLDQSEIYLEKAREHVQNSRDQGLKANILLTSAELTCRRNDYPYSLILSKQVLNMQKELGDTPGIADTHRLMGEIHLKQNQLEPARKHLSEALDSFQRLNIPLGEAECLKNLGLCEMSLQDSSGAAEHLKAALILFEKLGNTRESEILESHIRRLIH